MIVLDEASGPVSPRHQYAIAVRVQDGALHLRTKGGEFGARDVVLPVDEAALRGALSHAGLVDLVDDERARRVGVRVNALEIDGHRVRYLRTDLDDPAEARAALRRARDAILDAVRRALSTAAVP